jgi:Lon protease-like protein
MSGEQHDLENFDGVARLFPLPNLVFFPHVIQPLHIFEPRYRHMTADALASDRLIALVQQEAGWDEKEPTPPKIHRVACLGKIVADQKLADGRYNLLLRGLSRIRIVRELSTGKPYRSAKVELLKDQPCASSQDEAALRHALMQHVPVWFPAKGPVVEQFQRLLESDLTLGALSDIFSFALPLDAQFKQALLEQLDVETRTRTLLNHMETHGPFDERRFPPDFSSN